MEIFSDQIKRYIEPYIDFILIYSVFISIVLLYFLYRRHRIKSQFNSFKSIHLGFSGINLKLEKNEQRMYQQLWETNEQNILRIKQLENIIQKFKNYNIFVAILLLIFSHLLLKQTTWWGFLFSYLLRLILVLLAIKIVEHLVF